MTKKNEGLSLLGVYEPGMPWNPVEKTIMERRSTRKFKKDPVPASLIRRVLEAGRFAPSAGNQQPWKFVVITSPEIIAAMDKDAARVTRFFLFFLGYVNHTGIRRALSKFLAHVFAFRLFSNEMHPAPYGAMRQAALGKTPYWHNAPVVILILMDRRGVSDPAVDVGVTGQNMVLAAHSLGLGTCWVGFTKLLTYLPQWKKRFNVKYPYVLKESIALGWPASKADGEVAREVHLVDWYEGGIHDKPRTERQGE